MMLKTLSFLDLRDFCFSGRKGTFYEFGRRSDPLNERVCRPDSWYYEEEAAWARTALVLGNNVFAMDRVQRRMAYLPKVVRHLVSYTLGVCPRYAMYTGHRLDRPPCRALGAEGWRRCLQ
jgi:hypothetical protein